MQSGTLWFYKFHFHCCVTRSGGVGVAVLLENLEGDIRQEVSAVVRGQVGGGMGQGDRRGGGWILGVF